MKWLVSFLVWAVVLPIPQFAQDESNDYLEATRNFIIGNIPITKSACDSSQEIPNVAVCLRNLLYQEDLESADELTRTFNQNSLTDPQHLRFYIAGLARLETIRGQFHDADSLYQVYSELSDDNPEENEAGILHLIEWGHLQMRLDRFGRCDSLFEMAEGIIRELEENASRNSRESSKAAHVQILNNLRAYLYDQWGLSAVLQSRMERAESDFKRSLAIWSNSSETPHRWKFSCLNHFGFFLSKMGEYPRAEEMLIRAKEGMEEANMEYFILYADVLSNLAGVYRLLGRLENALKFYKLAGSIYQAKQNHIEHATILNNIALVYDQLDSLDLAQDYYENAAAVYRNKMGTDNLLYAGILNNLAGLLDYMEEYDQAERRYMEAIEVIEKLLGRESDYYVTMLSNLGILYENMGSPELAENNYLEGITIRRSIYGESHPKYIELLYNLAGLYAYSDPSKSIRVYKEANTRQLQLMKHYYSTLDEATRLSYFEDMELEFERFYSLAAMKDLDEHILQDVQNFSLQMKGMAAEYHVGERNNFMARMGHEEKMLFEQWKAIKDTLAMAVTSTKKELSDLNMSLEDIIYRTELLERKVARITDPVRLDVVDFELLRQELGEDEATIDFIKFQYFEEGFWTDSVFYYALLTRPGFENPLFIKLFEENQLNTLLQMQRIPALSSQVMDQLSRLIWNPIDPYLDGVRKVVLSPTGLLYKVPFHGLKEGDHFLAEKYSVHFFGSLRDFISEASLESIPESILLVGDVNFDSTSDDSGYTPKSFGGAFRRLPGTLQEIENIRQLAEAENWQVDLISGSKASEKYIREQAEDAEFGIFHFATHGYFYRQVHSPEYEDLNLRNKIITSENPLVRSGLVFSGVNQYWLKEPLSGFGYDGVLNALEISNLNLRNSGLIVLSACETGLGDIHNEAGVFGLQRAFRLAGADKLIYTLWPVSDEESQEFMTLFYQHLFQGSDVESSFHFAQTAMMKTHSPAHWAVYVLMN